MYYDSFRIALGCVLIHNGRLYPMPLDNLRLIRKLIQSHDLELVVVVFVLKICFTIYTVFI